MDAAQRATMHKRWVRWIKKIDNDLTGLFTDREVWHGIVDILRSNTTIPSSYVTEWMAANYAHAMAVGIRRQATYDHRGRDVSLAALLRDISRHPEVLSRSRYVRKYWTKGKDKRLVLKMGHCDYDRLVGPGRDHLSKEQVQRDLVRLQRDSKRVTRYVDTHVAHHDRRRQRKVPTFSELDTALDDIGEMFRRYNSLLLAAARIQMAPVFQYDWTQIFTVAWKP